MPPRALGDGLAELACRALQARISKTWIADATFARSLRTNESHDMGSICPPFGHLAVTKVDLAINRRGVWDVILTARAKATCLYRLLGSKAATAPPPALVDLTQVRALSQHRLDALRFPWGLPCCGTQGSLPIIRFPLGGEKFVRISYSVLPHVCSALEISMNLKTAAPFSVETVQRVEG